MYGRILDGHGNNFEMNDIYPNGLVDSDDGLDRRNTRPQLPPPAQCSAQEGNTKCRVSNIYEKIEDMHALRGVESRPMSCATFTSDEFSDDDGLANDRTDYSVIMNSSSQHTAVTNEVGEYMSHESTHYDKMTPKISIHPTMTFDTDSYINSDNDLRLSKFSNENRPEEESTTLLGADVMTRYASPRPSLPNLPQIALAEDAESYLSPRPSCPDVMINTGYCSTDDVREIKKRLLTAAHPSLLGTSKVSSMSVPETTHYQSPKDAANEVHYSTPRRK